MSGRRATGCGPDPCLRFVGGVSWERAPPHTCEAERGVEPLLGRQLSHRRCAARTGHREAARTAGLGRSRTGTMHSVSVVGKNRRTILVGLAELDPPCKVARAQKNGRILR